MSKVTKNYQPKQNAVKQITRWDSERVGNDVEFHFLTPEMKEDEPCLISRIHEQELLQHAIDFGMADDQDEAEQLLFDAFSDVRDSYWDNVEEIRLESAYNEACAYIESYKAAHVPMTEQEAKVMRIRVESLFGIQLPKVAA